MFHGTVMKGNRNNPLLAHNTRTAVPCATIAQLHYLLYAQALHGSTTNRSSSSACHSFGIVFGQHIKR